MDLVRRYDLGKGQTTSLQRISELAQLDKADIATMEDLSLADGIRTI